MPPAPTAATISYGPKREPGWTIRRRGYHVHMHLGGRGARRVLIGVIAIGFALRLSVWPRIFAGGHVYLDGPDAYYHLRRAAMTLENWPIVPGVDPMINYPAGGVISWPPLFDALLATLALPFRTDRALEVI